MTATADGQGSGTRAPAVGAGVALTGRAAPGAAVAPAVLVVAAAAAADKDDGRAQATPDVLRLIRDIVSSAHEQDAWVGCAASRRRIRCRRPRSWVGMDELSMTPSGSGGD